MDEMKPILCTALARRTFRGPGPTPGVCLGLAALLCLVAGGAAAQVEIVAPAEVLHDADLPVSITGLAPGATVDLQADFVTRGGSVWRSVATFAADEHGLVNTATTAPASGSWHVADPQAFIWSMVKTQEIPSTTSVFENDDRSVITLTVLTLLQREA